jgi:hypothetical protein
MYPDVPMPASLIIEPIDPCYLPIVSELMNEHGGGLNANEVFFPQGTVKRFIWPRILDWRYTIIFPDGYEMGLTETRDGRNILSCNPIDLVCPTCKRSLVEKDNSFLLQKSTKHFL